MTIKEIQNGITKARHNGRDYITDREIGAVGDTLTFSLHDGARWVNERTGDDVRESFIYSESENQFGELEAEMYPEEAECIDFIGCYHGQK